MPFDEKILHDFDRHVVNIEGVHKWLNTLYYDPEFSTLFNRPVLSLLMTGCDYLTENLKLLRTRYVTVKVMP